MRALLILLLLAISPSAFAVVNGDRVSSSSAIARSVVFIITPRGEGCSATLITQDTILTAAHCISGRNQTVLMKIGSAPRVSIRIARVIKHPNYRPFNRTAKSLSPDLAIARLERAAPAPFSPIAITGGASAGTSLTIAGWGKQSQEQNAPFGLLHSANVTAVASISASHLALVDPVTRNKRIGRGACSGDSGGPAIYGGGVAGVLSMATGAGQKGCGGLTLIVTLDNHMSWINNTMRALGAR